MTATSVSFISRHNGSLSTLIPLSFIAVVVGWRLLSGVASQEMMAQPDSKLETRHPVYWFNDGSVIVRVSSNRVDEQGGVVLFRIHECLLRRHSRAILKQNLRDGWDVPVITVPLALGLCVHDFTALLAHLYHDTPLSLEAPFQHVAAILRVSSSEQLDLPSVHALAKSYLIAMFPSGPFSFVHPSHLEEALSLALRYEITSIQKGLYYSLVTTTDFEPPPESDLFKQNYNALSSRPVSLTPTDIDRCRNLMNGIVEHFTPVLFEPPVTPHMACTNLLAEKWFPLVIKSALAGDSVYKPLEALEQLKKIDWVAEGLCLACVREKREEWTNEQEDVWEKMDAWLKMESSE